MRYFRDGPLWTFGVIGAAALVVSAPATYNLVALYHSDGTVIGVAATVALLVILELGAVAAKLATLWVREGRGWLQGFTLAALAVNTLSNFIHGGALASKNGMDWLAAWGGALVYAAFLPALLYLMLHLICARVAALRGVSVTVADEVALALRPVAHAAEMARQAQQHLAIIVPPPALPEPQPVYARPAPVVADVALEMPQTADPWACAACGTTATTGQRGAAGKHGFWRCKGCGARQERQNRTFLTNLPD